MTDTLPAWAMERVRELPICGDGYPDEGDFEVIAQAIVAAYQQGKQDGQRETREQDTKVAEKYRKMHDTGSGFASQPARSVAFAIREEIRAQSDEVQDA